MKWSSLAPIMLLGCTSDDRRGGRTSLTAEVHDTAGPEVWTSGPVVCTEPTRRAEAHFDTTRFPSETNSSIWLWGGGVVAMDLEGDGDLDLIAPSESGVKTYVHTPVGTWVESDDFFGEQDLSFGQGGSVADYDGDGDLDLYLLRYLRPNVLFRNDGDGRFRDVTSEAGVGNGYLRTTTGSWGDFDRDGDLDLYVGNYGWVDESVAGHADQFVPAEPSALYVNVGDGSFEDRSDLLPQRLHDGYTYVGGWYDLDGDGWLDLYVINDFGAAYSNVLLWNREGELVEDHNAVGLDLALTGMGLGIGDLNGDAMPDMIVPEWGKNKLLESLAGFWIDYSEDKGLVPDSKRLQKVGWGADLIDMDLDGDLDAPVAFGRVRYVSEEWINPQHQPDALYLQQEDGSFIDEGASWGVADDGVGRGFVTVDLDDDGYPDLFKRDLDGPDVLHMSRCGDRAWLRVQLRDDGPNTHGIGARITARTAGGSWWRDIRAGGTNYSSSGPPEAHFGLSDADTVTLEVRWPDGEVQAYDSIDTRQVVRISR